MTLTHRIITRSLPLAITASLTIMLAVGCRSSAPGSDSSPATPAGSARSDAEALASHSAAPWQTLSVPVSVKVKDSGLPRLSGTMTMTRDSDIKVSLRVLGMEVGAMSVTTDSVYGYAKLQKMYVAESISDLLGGYPATVGNLQSLLLDRLFTIGDTTPSLKNAAIEPATGGYRITPSIGQGDPAYTFEITLPDNRITAVVFTHSATRAVVSYPDEGEIEITAATSSRSLGASLSLNMGRAEWDTSSATPQKPFTIPRGYRHIKASALLKALSSL